MNRLTGRRSRRRLTAWGVGLHRWGRGGNIGTNAATLVLLALACVLCRFAAAADDAKRVLVLYSNNRLVPANVTVDRGLRDALSNAEKRPVVIFSEFLDRPDFSGEAHEGTLRTYLREKYAAQPPDAIVTVSDEALEFVLRRRPELFEHVPVVFTVASQSLLQSMAPLPADVVGVPMEYDFSGTIAQALRWHPGTRHVVIVTGASERDRDREKRLRREVPGVAGTLPVEFLAGLPTPTLLRRLGELDASALVFTPGYFEDGDGRHFAPRDSARLVAGAANAPVYGPVDTFIGTGVVGGRMPSFEAMGRQSGEIVEQLFEGVTPAALQLPKIVPNTLQVDWRQIERWHIDEVLVPGDAVVQFRQPSFWAAYRNLALAVAAVILLQAALIAILFLEHRRRRSAELAVQKQHVELAHASRLAVAGELTASIAHEINQPLGAVQTSADAADLILQGGGDRRGDLLRIVTRIRRDNMRASDVIRRLRALLAKHEPERQPFDLITAVSDATGMLRGEALRRQVTFDVRFLAARASIVGDQTQIQQVLINLMLNAMDAVADMPEERRTIVVTVEGDGRTVSVVVRDRGRGVAAEHLARLFDSFFSTKQRGMGLGLSIARTIVEANGGRIWAEAGIAEGAAFHVELPSTGTGDHAAAAA